MGLFDGIAEIVENAIGRHPGGLAGLMGEAFNDLGGLQGVVDKLNAAGLGPTVHSWLGRGENVPISAEEIQGVIGAEQLQRIATKLGIPADQISNILAHQLPTAVDAASPDGRISKPTA